MKIAVLKETLPGERRVALIPRSVSKLVKAQCEVLVEQTAGAAAGYPDSQYEAQGASLVDRTTALQADIVLQVRGLGANPQAGRDDLAHYSSAQTIIAMCDPLGAPECIQEIAETGARLFALELIPRITRAQSMDVLSSLATIMGYRAALLAAIEMPKMFPLMMTAAGTMSPVRVFVIGAGVAGLQAIATARRLGAIVQAYDVRPAVREQVESLGGKFVELKLDSTSSEDAGGYAKKLDEEFYEKQRALMAEIAAENDVVIATAAIPGKTSPLLLTAAAVEGMADGSVIVDLAAERGGNCELSQLDQRVVEHGVTILAPGNITNDLAQSASQMLSNNIVTFLLNMIRDGQLTLDREDEIVTETLVAEGGQVCSARIRELLKLEPQATAGSGGDNGNPADPVETDSPQSESEASAT